MQREQLTNQLARIKKSEPLQRVLSGFSRDARHHEASRSVPIPAAATGATARIHAVGPACRDLEVPAEAGENSLKRSSFGLWRNLLDEMTLRSPLETFVVDGYTEKVCYPSDATGSSCFGSGLSFAAHSAILRVKSEQKCGPDVGRKANERMGLYNTRRPKEASRRRGAPQETSRRFSAIAGGALILVASLGFLWLFLYQFSPSLVPFVFPHSINAPVDPLVAAGITLSTPAQGQEPRLTRQQALLLVNQMEPEAAAHNDGVTASYTLFSYQGHNSATSFHDVPAWLVHYTQVSGPSPDTSADPHATSAHHDLYVFLDARSGEELLAIWL